MQAAIDALDFEMSWPPSFSFETLLMVADGMRRFEGRLDRRQQ